MNENLNLVEILKDCPKGTKLYSTVFGEVEFKCIEKNAIYPIIVRPDENTVCSFTADGRTLVRFLWGMHIISLKDAEKLGRVQA